MSDSEVARLLQLADEYRCAGTPFAMSERPQAVVRNELQVALSERAALTPPPGGPSKPSKEAIAEAEEILLDRRTPTVARALKAAYAVDRVAVLAENRRLAAEWQQAHDWNNTLFGYTGRLREAARHAFDRWATKGADETAAMKALFGLATKNLDEPVAAPPAPHPEAK